MAGIPTIWSKTRAMKVVVTGGSGQLGSAVLERLVANRKIKKIVSLDLVPPRVPSPKLEYRIADMRDPGLERHLEGADALVHLAFIVVKDASRESMYAVNVEGSKRLFDAAAAHGLTRIVYSSSVGAYGVLQGHPEPIVETTPRRRTGYLAYADDKYDVEEYLDRFEAEHPNVAVVRLRPGVLLGRRIAHISERFLSLRLWPVVGHARVCVVWDEDVADAVILALLGEHRGAYNVVAADSLTGEELARLAGFRPVKVPGGALQAAVKLHALIRRRAVDHDIGWIRAGEVEMLVSNEKARSELGWMPRYPTAADVALAFGKQARKRTDKRLTLFMALVGRIAPRVRDSEMPRDGKTTSLRIHLDVTGPTGGDYELLLDKGTFTVKTGIPRPSDSSITVSPETLFGLLAGTETPSTAAMLGKMRVKGEPLAGLVMTGMVEGFRKSVQMPGPPGTVARRLAKWFEQGARPQ